METTSVLGCAITVINIIILIEIIFTLILAGRNVYFKEPEDDDYNFYQKMFYGSCFLFLANCMALYRGIEVYINHVLDPSREISLATYLDRTCMLFAYFVWFLLAKKYRIKWFKVRHKQTGDN